MFQPTTTLRPTSTSVDVSTTTTPKELPEDRIPTTVAPAEVSSSEVDTTTSSPASVEHGSGVSTLAVYEVTPSSQSQVEDKTPAPQEPPEIATTTHTPHDLSEGETSPPEEVPEDATSLPLDQAEDDSEDTAFITPERASLWSHKDAYLRYLQTGKVPPYLESDRFNEMDDIYS